MNEYTTARLEGECTDCSLVQDIWTDEAWECLECSGEVVKTSGEVLELVETS